LNKKKSIENHIRGWLPKESSVAYEKLSKSRWKRPYWITFIMLVLVAAAFVAYIGVQTCLRYSNPQLDLTSSYFEKTVNCSVASIGDVIEVSVQVYWHGYIIPECKRDVKIVDSFPKNNFQLVDGNNIYESNGYGGSYQLKYLLKIIGNESANVELPKPLLYLDNYEIPLQGTNSVLELRNFLNQ
jgi:hypothetical protein